MKLRYLFTALLFTGAAAPLQAQSIDHMRKLLQEIQQEIDCLEKEQAETLKPRKEPQPVESTEYVDGVIAVDTLPSGNDAVMIVLFNDNTWKYLRNRDYVKDSEIYTRCWDTTKLFPYRDVVKLADLPRSVDIELVDSLKCYHYPYKAAIRSKFGMRRRRKHQGVIRRLRQPDRHPPRQRTGNLLRPPLGADRPRRRMGRGGADHRLRRQHGTQHRPASPLRDALLRTVVRPRTTDRLPERQPAARNLPAQKELSGHPFERLAGLRRRGGRSQRRKESRGGPQSARFGAIPQDPFGRHAGRHRGALRHDRFAALPAQRHFAHHDAAHRPLAARTVATVRR